MNRFLIICPLSILPPGGLFLLASPTGKVPVTHAVWFSNSPEWELTGVTSVCLRNSDTVASALATVGLRRLGCGLTVDNGAAVFSPIPEKKSFFSRLKSFFRV